MFLAQIHGSKDLKGKAGTCSWSVVDSRTLAFYYVWPRTEITNFFGIQNESPKKNKLRVSSVPSSHLSNMILQTEWLIDPFFFLVLMDFGKQAPMNCSHICSLILQGSLSLFNNTTSYTP
jgi:hypothetical protein